MQVSVLSCSLNDDSRSARLAQAAKQALAETGAEPELIDLRDWSLPICDGKTAYADPTVQALAGKIQASAAVLMAVPVYNFYANAAAKNCVELTGEAWQDKVVGFLCAAGGKGSYMSVMSLANSLMLDFHCLIVPRFVYATGDDFASADGLASELQNRIDNLAGYTTELAKATQTLPQR
jgi:FMN reductase